MSWDKLNHVEIAYLASKVAKGGYRIGPNTRMRLDKTDHFSTGRRNPGKGIILVKSNASLCDDSVLRVFLSDKT